MVSASEHIQLFINSIKSLRSFDYRKAVLPEYHQEFIDLECPQIIEDVACEFEKAISEILI